MQQPVALWFSPQCRHCASPVGLRTTCVSLLFAGSNAELCRSVEVLEAQGVRPGMTAACPVCGRVSVMMDEEGGMCLYFWKCFGPAIDSPLALCLHIG